MTLVNQRNIIAPTRAYLESEMAEIRAAARRGEDNAKHRLSIIGPHIGGDERNQLQRDILQLLAEAEAK